MALHDVEVIGGNNFWLYSKTTGYDITHPPTPDAPPIYPRIRVDTTTEPVEFDPAKTALVVIDLQNYFLSPHLGRPADSPWLKLVDTLLDQAIPACRKAGIPVVWLGWGLTDEDIDEMPPTIVKGFAADTNFEGSKRVEKLGSDIGSIRLEDGSTINAGRVLMKNQWNSDFYCKLKEAAERNDMWLYKNRLSAFWGGTDVENTLKSRGIKTLLFAGANLDQCVGGSLQGAYTQGWDCLLLSDGTATTSPEFARKCIEFNTEGGWGFVLTCQQFVDGVDKMQMGPVFQGQKSENAHHADRQGY
ncbi:Ureidoacrylate amidohydrolase RutB [Apiospora sp. TS-2023a]